MLIFPNLLKGEQKRRVEMPGSLGCLSCFFITWYLFSQFVVFLLKRFYYWLGSPFKSLWNRFSKKGKKRETVYQKAEVIEGEVLEETIEK